MSGMRIAIPLYDRFTALDAVGPYEVLSRLPGASVTWLAHEPGVVHNDNAMLGIEATAAFEDLPDPEIVLSRAAPARTTSSRTSGSSGGSAARTRPRVDDVGVHRLAAPGRRGRARRPRGHDALARHGRPRALGARPTGQRVVEQGKVITAAGVSSGIDMGLVLAAKIAGPRWRRRSSWHRVRPPAALRLRLGGEGRAGDRRADPEPGGGSDLERRTEERHRNEALKGGGAFSVAKWKRKAPNRARRRGSGPAQRMRTAGPFTAPYVTRYTPDRAKVTR